MTRCSVRQPLAGRCEQVPFTRCAPRVAVAHSGQGSGQLKRVLAFSTAGSQVRNRQKVRAFAPSKWDAPRTGISVEQLVIVGTSKIGEILGSVRSAIERVEGATWAEVAERLTRLGHYEFDDYA
ncbi:Imm8 family immunity protein [Lentzea sp. NPDC005914]|uniref:Imm8 family immunity protein n=1 Tax=Lentzea sp. NPDC005914 TaxID=3154572 RepID=UPI0033CE965C